MTRRDNWLPWLLLGIVIGVLIGLWLAQHDTPPPSPCADAKEPGAAGDEREGTEPPLDVLERRPA